MQRFRNQRQTADRNANGELDRGHAGAGGDRNGGDLLLDCAHWLLNARVLSRLCRERQCMSSRLKMRVIRRMRAVKA
jgi:hypothetical protein